MPQTYPTPAPAGYKLDPFEALQAGNIVPVAMAATPAEIIENLKKDFAAGWPLNALDKQGGTLLCAALDLGLGEVAVWLIEQGIDVTVKEQVGYKRTALHWAAKAGLVDIVKHLLEKGLDIEDPGSNGFTPLLMACDGAGKIDIRNPVEYDVKGKVIKNSPRVKAILQHQQDYIATVLLLLEKGANPNAVSTGKGHAPLHYCGDKCLPEIAKLLLNHGAKVDVRAKEAGITPLHFAARHGFMEVVKILLDHKANPNEQDDYGFTPLHEAVLGNHVEAVKALLEAGANPTIGMTKGFKPYVNHENAIDMAKKCGAKTIIKLLESKKGS